MPDYVEEDGSRYVWVRRITRGSFSTDIGGGEEQAAKFRGHKKIAEMSVEELAAKLRPRLYVGEDEYLLDHDPIEMAQKIKEKVFRETSGHRPDFAQLEVPAPQTKPDFIIPDPFDGTPPNDDDRISYDHHFVSWPAMTSMRIENIACTATTIGVRTASSAAHCFSSDGITVNPQYGYTPYASDTSPQRAYGTFTATAVAIPSGWNGSDAQFDFARITFPAGTFSNWGWVGTANVGYGASGTAANMWGYPVDWPFPRLILKSGKLNATGMPSYDCTGHAALRHDLDIWGGDSGAGLLLASSSAEIGIQTNHFYWCCSPERYSNEVRRWDTTTYNFFAQAGIWP